MKRVLYIVHSILALAVIVASFLRWKGILLGQYADLVYIIAMIAATTVFTIIHFMKKQEEVQLKSKDSVADRDK